MENVHVLRQGGYVLTCVHEVGRLITEKLIPLNLDEGWVSSQSRSQ